MLRVLPAFVAALALLLPAGVCYCPHDADEAACECERDAAPAQSHDDCPCVKSAEPTVAPAAPLHVPAADCLGVVVPPAAAAHVRRADNAAGYDPSPPLFLCHCVFQI
jgi:hypothetical protein